MRGTVRDLNNEAKIGPLRKSYGDAFSGLELVKANLMDASSLEQAIEGSDYVVHTASPFPLAAPKNEDEIIKPAVEGTLAVVKACHKHKVKRLVITSSCAAIERAERADAEIPELTEENWSDVSVCNAYYKSKTLAERAAWEY